MLSDHTELVRLVWNSAHFENGVLMGSAFPSDDLLGVLDEKHNPRYLSLDDHLIISRASVDWRIRWGQREGRDEREKRHEAKFAFIPVHSILASKCPTNQPLFEVTREPLAIGEDGPDSPENPAHCGVKTLALTEIASMTRSQRRVRVEYMRTRLTASITSVLDYAELFIGQAA